MFLFKSFLLLDMWKPLKGSCCEVFESKLELDSVDEDVDDEDDEDKAGDMETAPVF